MDNLRELKQFRCPICKKLIIKYETNGNLTLVGKCPRCHKVSVLIRNIKS
jgi:phage FluMu protein Com